MRSQRMFPTYRAKVKPELAATPWYQTSGDIRRDHKIRIMAEKGFTRNLLPGRRPWPWENDLKERGD